MSSSDAAAAAGRMRRAFLVLASVALLAGCGFHLQGTVALPEGVRNVYVAVPDQFSPFATELQDAVSRAGATKAASASAADTVIRVTHDRTGRRVLSVSARNTPQEYEVFYTVEYSVDRAGKEAVPTQTLELTRSYSFEESKLLAKQHEEDLLREEMARELAALVLRRLQSL
jgi:LPS-assembly lipoprotein